MCTGNEYVKKIMYEDKIQIYTHGWGVTKYKYFVNVFRYFYSTSQCSELLFGKSTFTCSNYFFKYFWSFEMNYFCLYQHYFPHYNFIA